MVEQGIIGDGLGVPTVSAVIAQRSLRDYEASPVAVICAAFQMAADNRDGDALAEVVLFGVSMLAKWPDVLDMALDDGHPRFNRAVNTSASQDADGAESRATSDSVPQVSAPGVRCSSCGAEYITGTARCPECMSTDLHEITDP